MGLEINLRTEPFQICQPTKKFRIRSKISLHEKQLLSLLAPQQQRSATPSNYFIQPTAAHCQQFVSNSLLLRSEPQRIATAARIHA